MRYTRATRVAVIGAVSALLLAAAGVTAWRVLRPSEVSTPATTPYPEPYLPAPGWQGNLRSAPLFLDLRMRIYASKNRVWADANPAENYETSAYWSYRRWPAQLVGVVANPEVVTSTWTDGMLVGIDAKTGKVLWHNDSEALGTKYIGRRTGATTVYDPPGFFSTGSQVIVSGPKTIRGYAVSTGIQLWSKPVPACERTGLTTSSQFLYLDSCTGTLYTVDAVNGTESAVATGVTAVQPLGCVVGHSTCNGMRTTGSGASTGWLLPSLTKSPALATPEAVLVDDMAIASPTESELLGRDPRTNEVKWSWKSDGPAKVIASDAERVYLLTPAHTLITILGATGAEVSRYSIVPELEVDGPYDTQFTYASDGYVVLVRTKPAADGAAKDDDYYLTARPVLVAGS